MIYIKPAGFTSLLRSYSQTRLSPVIFLLSWGSRKTLMFVLVVSVLWPGGEPVPVPGERTDRQAGPTTHPSCPSSSTTLLTPPTTALNLLAVSDSPPQPWRALKTPGRQWQSAGWLTESVSWLRNWAQVTLRAGTEQRAAAERKSERESWVGWLQLVMRGESW